MPLHIVMGPPCAGKSTFARAQRGVVIDLDDIEERLGGTRYAQVSPVRADALRARKLAVDAAIDSAAETWLIHSAPSAAAIERYRAAGAVFHLVDPGLDECLARAESRPAYTAQLIRDWYSAEQDFHGLFRGGTSTVSRVMGVRPLNGWRVRVSEQNTDSTTTVTEETDSQGQVESDFKAITSQEEFDKAIQARIARERKRFEDYEDVKAKAARLDELEAQNKTEAEKAAERLQAAEKRAAELEQKANRAEVAAAKGVPAELLTGSTVEELEASADALIKFKEAAASRGHVAPNEGRGESVSGEGTAGQFARFLGGQLNN